MLDGSEKNQRMIIQSLLNDHHTEDLSDDDNSELEKENLPPVTSNSNPNPRPALHGPTLPWVVCLETWSAEQDQPMSSKGDRSYYHLSEGSSADKVLTILIRRVDQNEIQGRTTLHYIKEVKYQCKNAHHLHQSS